MVCFELLNAFLPFNDDSDGKRRLIFSSKIVNNMVACLNIAIQIYPKNLNLSLLKEIEKINLQRKIAVVVSALFGKRLVCRRK